MEKRALAIAAVAGMAAGVHAQVTITPLVIEGDPVSGVGAVTLINNIAVNSGGQWIVEADTDDPNLDTDAVLIKNASLYLREGQALTEPTGALLDSFDSVTLNDNGDSGFNFFLDGTTGTGDDSGIYFNEELVIQESFESMAPGFSAMTPYVGFFEVKINDTNQMLVVASVDDPNIASTVDRALIRIDYNATTGAFTETIIAKEGDTLPGMSAPLTEIETSPQEFDFNNAGDAIYVPEVGTQEHIYLNQTLLAVEGGASPVAGRTWASFATVGVGINDAGDYVYAGQLSGDTATDLVIIKNGTVFRQEGDPAPGLPGLNIQGFGTSRVVDIANDGSVVWFADTDDPNTASDGALYVDDQVLLREGVTTVQTVYGNLTVETIRNGTDAFAISSNGRYVIAEVVLTDGVTDRDAALLMDLGDPAPGCYANCDGSTALPILNVADFGCFLSKFAAGDPYANCDGSTEPPALNVADFGCFLTKFAAGCP